MKARPWRRVGALPIFWQTLILLLAAVILAQAIGFLLLFLNPPPRPQFNRLEDIAAQLKGELRDTGDRDRDLLFRVQPRPPVPPPGMAADPPLVHALATRLGLADRDVRLYFEPDRPRGEPFRRGPRRPVTVRTGEALFFTPLVAGMATARGWRVVETPPRPLIAPWQRRMILWLLLSAVALTPLAWLFARAISGPIRRFADAADRLGGDPRAPAVAEDGPAELRVTARALNAMQARLAEYVGERTAMIGAIAHDLRTPLARIAFRIEGAAEPMREKVLGDVEQMRAMLAATIGFVRSTGTGGERAEVDLGALLAAVAEQECDLGRPVTMAGREPLTVVGDPMALERLFQNLIDNALAYGGSAELAMRREHGFAAIAVADRGPGLPAEMLVRAFQPFVRGDPSRNRATGGIGLGLTIARTIAENHGGTLHLANRPGGGLEALCRLPLAG